MAMALWHRMAFGKKRDIYSTCRSVAIASFESLKNIMRAIARSACSGFVKGRFWHMWYKVTQLFIDLQRIKWGRDWIWIRLKSGAHKNVRDRKNFGALQNLCLICVHMTLCDKVGCIGLY